MVVGAGYIAVELAGILNALGSEVTLVIRYDKVCPRGEGGGGAPVSDCVFVCVQVLRRFDSLLTNLVTEELVSSGVNLVQHSQVWEGGGVGDTIMRAG